MGLKIRKTKLIYPHPTTTINTAPQSTVHTRDWGEYSAIKSLQEDFRLQITSEVNTLFTFSCSTWGLETGPLEYWHRHSFLTFVSISSVLLGRLLFDFHDSPTRMKNPMPNKNIPRPFKSNSSLPSNAKSSMGFEVKETYWEWQLGSRVWTLVWSWRPDAAQLVVYFPAVVTLPTTLLYRWDNLSFGDHFSQQVRWSILIRWCGMCIPRSEVGPICWL